MVRTRELLSRMRFWTAIVGYDPHDHSISHRLYLIYVVIFFSLWGFSVLVLLADVGIWVVSFFKGRSPGSAAVLILAVGLMLDAVLRAYKACRRSPFVFSEEDAGLICQTPVDRRQVALAWLLGDWLPACLPFVALAVVLCFSSLQLSEKGPFLWSYLPRYWLAAFGVTMIILPLHLSFKTGVYTLGALRLRGDQDLRALAWLPIGFAMMMIILVFTNQGLLSMILSPVIFPLSVSFGGQSWLTGFVLAVFLALVSLLALYIASPRLNLSRAAQESSAMWAYQQASLSGDARLAERMRIRNQLGVMHPPSSIPGRPGAWSLVWKDAVISARSMSLGRTVAWLAIFGISVVWVVAPDWGTRIWAWMIWCWLVGQRGTERFRSDLELWVISRQLAISGRAALVAEFVIPVSLVIAVTWLAIGFGALSGFSPPVTFILLAPVAIISVILAASFDIVRKCQGSELLSGQAAQPGAVGLLLGALVAGIPMLIAYWLTHQSNSPGVSLMIAMFGFALGSGVSFLLWQITASAYQGIK